MNLGYPFIQTIPLSVEENVPVTSLLIGRIPGLLLPADRNEALLLQQPLHRQMVERICPSTDPCASTPFLYAGQCHGSEIALVDPPFLPTEKIDHVDGLITAHSGVMLGITVADCAPVWIVEKRGQVGALVHSGKKGTEAEIVPKAIRKMQETFGIDPRDIIVAIGPCIRPPCYEVDFASIIAKQAACMGVTRIEDQKICTACHLDRYYSYRRERGKTGHMLALLLLQGTNHKSS